MPNSHESVQAIYNEIKEITKEKQALVELNVSSHLYMSALIINSGAYKEYKIPNTEEEVSLYWLDNKYDEIKDTNILHHYRSGLTLVYDNGIRSIGPNGESTYEEDVEDSLYIQTDTITKLELQYNTINKFVSHITPHIDAITANIYDVLSINGSYQLVDSKVVGYKVVDVDTVMSPLQSDWKSYQLLGNLIEYNINV